MDKLIDYKERVYNTIDKSRWNAVEKSGNEAETNNYFEDIKHSFNVYNQEVMGYVRDKEEEIKVKNDRIAELEEFRNSVIDKMNEQEKAKEDNYFGEIALQGFSVEKLQYANNNIKECCGQLYNAIIEKDRSSAMKAHDKLQQNSTIIDALTVNHIEIDDMDK